MGFPSWLTETITARRWRYKRESQNSILYQSPDSVERVFVPKRTKVDRRHTIYILRKLKMTDDEIQSFLETHSDNLS